MIGTNVSDRGTVLATLIHNASSVYLFGDKTFARRKMCTSNLCLRGNSLVRKAGSSSPPSCSILQNVLLPAGTAFSAYTCLHRTTPVN